MALQPNRAGPRLGAWHASPEPHYLSPSRARFNADPCTRSARFRQASVRRLGDAHIVNDFEGGVMRTIGIACVALALAILPSPLIAQQAPPEQQPPPTQQGPVEQQLPPPSESESEPAPPPLPPMPHSRHRRVDMSEHHSARSHRHATTHKKHHASHPRHHAARSHHKAAHKHHRKVHASKSTIRSCHRMNYKQIMRHSICRKLMMQDLEAAERRHHRKAHHHHASHHRTTKHHSSKHHTKHAHATKKRHH